MLTGREASPPASQCSPATSSSVTRWPASRSDIATASAAHDGSRSDGRAQPRLAGAFFVTVCFADVFALLAFAVVLAVVVLALWAVDLCAAGFAPLAGFAAVWTFALAAKGAHQPARVHPRRLLAVLRVVVPVVARVLAVQLYT